MKQTDPFIMFKEWFEKAEQTPEIKQANAINLATATKDGRPSNRMVLLKSFNEQGFVFYTNLNSRKGNELKENPYVSLCLYWEVLNRQIRIEGKVTSVSNEEADAYFNSRSLESRLGAWASKQSQVMESSIDLLRNAVMHSLKNKMQAIERPEFWSGFRVNPIRIEFWQDGKARLHDRVLFSRKTVDTEWTIQRLYP